MSVTLDFSTFQALDKSKPSSGPKWSAYAKPGPYNTKLSGPEEQQFQQWVKQNKIPWQDSPTSDYDMRGFWKAQRGGDERAKRASNRHFPDVWKTPYHETFSRESQYALPTAGHWEGDRFVPPQKGGPVTLDFSTFQPVNIPQSKMSADTKRALRGWRGEPTGGDEAAATAPIKRDLEKAKEFATKPLVSPEQVAQTPELAVGPKIASWTMRKMGLGWEADLYDDINQVAIEQVSGMTSPFNIGLLFIGGFLEKIPVLARASAGLFSVTQLRDAYQQVKEAVHLYSEGQPREGRKLLMGGAVSTLFGAMSAAGAMAKAPKTTETKTEEPVAHGPVGPDAESWLKYAEQIPKTDLTPEERGAQELDRVHSVIAGIRAMRTERADEILANAPEKRPYQEPAQVVRGRQPLTREEREQERLDERTREVHEEIAAEKRRRFAIAQRALDEARQMAEQREQERGFRVIEPTPDQAAIKAAAESKPTTAEAPPTEAPTASLTPPPTTLTRDVGHLGKVEEVTTRALLEAEQRKVRTQDPTEIDNINRESQENKQLLADVKADRQAAERLISDRKKPKAYKGGEQIEGTTGKQSTLNTVTSNIPIRYRIVDADNLKPSHNPQTFEPTEGYPAVQERDYKNDRDAQLAVIAHGQDYDPAFTLSDAPGPEHGPPIITPDGIVLGGNSRAMSTLRMYADEKDAAYRDALMSKLMQFGFDPKSASNAMLEMNHPILVREVTQPPTDINEMRALGSDLNRVFTRKLSEYEQAVSAGKRISQETLDMVGHQLTELGEGSSLRDLLRERSAQILERLQGDGIIAATERRAFIDERTGSLNEAGKDFVERALLGAVVDDPLVLANAPKGVLRKIERALSPLARIKARGEPWDITDYLKESLHEHIAAASKGVPVADHFNPPNLGMFERESAHPITQALAETLEKGSPEVKNAFERYAQDAEVDVKNQGAMAFFQPPNPWESFNREFGAKVRPDEWGTLRPHTEETAPVTKTLEPAPPEDLERIAKETKKPVTLDKMSSKEGADTYRIKDADGKVKGSVVVTPKGDSLEIAWVSGTLNAETGEFSPVGRRVIRAMMDELKRLYPQAERITGNRITGTRAEANKETSLKITRPEPMAPPPEVPIETKPADVSRETFRVDLEKSFKSLTPDQIDAAMALVDARARAVGKSTDDWLREKNLRAEEHGQHPESESVKASVTFNENETIIKAFSSRKPTIAGLVHEIGHIFRRDLNPDELAEAERYFTQAGEWNRAAEEHFARSFEKYLADGKAPTEGLRGVFSKLKAWMVGIYQAMKGAYQTDIAPGRKGTPLDIKISPEVDRLFSKMLGGTESLEAPPEEAEAPKAREPEPAFGQFLSVKEMSDADLRTAKDALESQLGQVGLSKQARQRLLDQQQPFIKELARRGEEAPKGKSDQSVIFTKDKFDSAIERLKKKKPPITLNYTDDEEETIGDLADVMGHLFENGYRDFDSNANRAAEVIGDWTKAYARASWAEMLARGKSEAQTRLERFLPDTERRKLSSQFDLFQTHEAKNRQIELPPGVEPRREQEESTRLVTNRAPDDVGHGPEGRAETRPTPTGTNQPGGGGARGTTGRGVRPTGQAVRGAGVREEPARAVRAVQPPAIDVAFIPSEGPVVEPAEWESRLRAANLPHQLPPPTVSLTPEIEDKLVFKGQPEVVQAALTSLQKYKSFILASSTGTGKTYTGSAIIAERKPRFGLILTPSANLSDQWIRTAQDFGVDVKPLPKSGIPTEPGVYVGTYSTAAGKKGLEQFNWNLLLADESHQARKWWTSKRGMFLRNISNAADEAVYTSATPFHNALELGYMEKLGLWKKQGLDNWLRREFNTYIDPQTGQWRAPFNPRKLAALRGELINRGMMVNLDRDMRGYDVNFAISPLSADTREQVRNIAQAFKLAEDYFKRTGGGNMMMAARGNAVTFMKSFLERVRLPEAIELGKKLEKEGWKVAFFTENKTEVPEIYDFLKEADAYYGGEISRLMPKLPGVVDVLKQAFGNDIANFTGPHGLGRQEELDSFNRGDKKHLVATYAAGGLGVSMHDTMGDKPRAAIYLGPPWSGVMFDQAIGRPWRFGTKSNVAAYILTSNAKPEMNLVFRKVLPRFESLKASISGVHKEDPIVESMKDLDSFLSYSMGEKEKNSVSDFLGTVETRAISSIGEAKIPSAEQAKNQGMQVERRMPIKPPSTLAYSEPPDLPELNSRAADLYSRAAKAVRRPYVPKETEKDVDDPRNLEFIERTNREALGIPQESGSPPPQPPDEIMGTNQIPPPGSGKEREFDLANPATARWYYERVRERYPKLVDEKRITEIAKFERGLRAYAATFHTAPYVLKQFEMTADIPRKVLAVEQTYRRRVADTLYQMHQIMGEFSKDLKGRHRIYEALARAHDPATELKGQNSEWVEQTPTPFTDRELQVAQRLRDEITEPIIDDVQGVRPDVGKRLRYAPLVRQISEFASTLYPDLHGQIPTDMWEGFSKALRGELIPLSKDPYSPHTFERSGTPKKTLDIEEVLDGYIRSMVKVAEATPLSREMAVKLSSLPEGKALTDFATRYVRNFFGVKHEYDTFNRLLTGFTRPIAHLAYSAALDLNPGWFVLHSTKVPFNVWPELGSKYTTKGYLGMMSPEGRELVARSGVLNDVTWRFGKPQGKLRKTFSQILHSGMLLSETIDRGVAYLGGLEKAKDLGYFGDPSKVGKITNERLNQLAAEGINTKKGLDLAYDTVARSNFMYTPGNVQFFIKDHPLAGMFKSYPVRQAEFFASVWKLAREAKKQSMEPEEFAAVKAARGEYDYIDAPAKFRRLMFGTAVAALGALALEASGSRQRIWPYHLPTLLSTPIVFAIDTYDLLKKTLDGNATEKMWERWLTQDLPLMVPGGVGLKEMLGPEPKKKHHKYQIEPIPRTKYSMEPVPESQ